MLYPFVSNPFAVAAVGFGITTCIYVTSAIGVACYIPEMFPTRLRLRGVGFASALARLANVGIPYLVVYAYSGWGLMGQATLMASLFLAVLFVILIMGIETQHRALEDVANNEVPTTIPDAVEAVSPPQLRPHSSLGYRPPAPEAFIPPRPAAQLQSALPGAQLLAT